MHKVIIVLGVILVQFSFTVAPQEALASPDPVVLIMIEDVDIEGVPRKNNFSGEILKQVVNKLKLRNLRAYQESDLTQSAHMRGRLPSFATQRTDSNLINLSQGFRNPRVDAVIFLSLFSNVVRRGHISDLNLQIEGRILNVNDGRRLSSWVKNIPYLQSLPNECFSENKSLDVSCRAATINHEVRRMSDNISARLSKQISYLIDKGQITPDLRTHQTAREYSVIIQGFAPHIVQYFEEYLVAFTGYIRHRPVLSKFNHVEFLYESRISITRLRRNLEKMAEELEVDFVLVFNGSTFHLRNRILFQNQGKNNNRADKEW